MVKFVSKMEKIRLEPMESVDSQDSRIEIDEDDDDFSDDDDDDDVFIRNNGTTGNTQSNDWFKTGEGPMGQDLPIFGTAKKVRISQRQNQGWYQLLLTVSWSYSHLARHTWRRP